MEAFLSSTLVVALGEIGDKTQLLALVLAARFKKAWPIAFGILAATLANHSVAGLLGAWLSNAVSPDTLRWAVGISFLLIALWALKPDTLDSRLQEVGALGVFGVTFTAFFLAEIGDKTQVATIALAARYPDLFAVVLGTTCGMLIADVPVAFIGDRAAARIPMHVVRYCAAGLFAVMGVVALLGRTLIDAV